VLKETLLKEDFMDVKDFFYNIGKSICIPTVMESKELRPKLLSIFLSFIDNEYSQLHFAKRHLVSSDSLLDRMTYANMIDTEQYKKYRR
jgi:hypothetical protein